MTNLPVPSIVRTPSGTLSLAAGATRAMRSPSTTTVMSGRAGPPVVSMTVTWVMARVVAGVAGTAGRRRAAASTSGSIVAPTLPDGIEERQTASA